MPSSKSKPSKTAKRPRISKKKTPPRPPAKPVTKNRPHKALLGLIGMFLALGTVIIAYLGWYSLQQQNLSFPEFRQSPKSYPLVCSINSPLYFSPGEEKEITTAVVNEDTAELKVAIRFDQTNTSFYISPTNNLDFGSLGIQEKKVKNEVKGGVHFTFPGHAAIWEPWGEQAFDLNLEANVNNALIFLGKYQLRIAHIPYMRTIFSYTFYGVIIILAFIAQEIFKNYVLDRKDRD
jgi:hypothetical protein